MTPPPPINALHANLCFRVTQAWSITANAKRSGSWITHHLDGNKDSISSTWAQDTHVIVKAFAGGELPWWLSGEESVCHAGDSGDTGSIPGSERSPRKGNSNPLQYSCLENPIDRGTWQATVLAGTWQATVLTKSHNWSDLVQTHTYGWKERY